MVTVALLACDAIPWAEMWVCEAMRSQATIRQRGLRRGGEPWLSHPPLRIGCRINRNRQKPHDPCPPTPLCYGPVCLGVWEGNIRQLAGTLFTLVTGNLDDFVLGGFNISRVEDFVETFDRLNLFEGGINPFLVLPA